ncbi:hypothetical protein PCL_03923 [Purpureocillium lilacinum]|uniref:Uncharacterized protein n=1 Tax=Purpureocillium lilacinum TaxID=33203 RepID=A0A2U3EQF1_PURLI|nr:hypothetical protein PCL_03923 [Purpureocillium lilacinum]
MQCQCRIGAVLVSPIETNNPHAGRENPPSRGHLTTKEDPASDEREQAWLAGPGAARRVEENQNRAQGELGCAGHSPTTDATPPFPSPSRNNTTKRRNSVLAIPDRGRITVAYYFSQHPHGPSRPPLSPYPCVHGQRCVGVPAAQRPTTHPPP